MDLTLLPELVLDVIADQLDFEDLMNFSQTCRAFLPYQPKYREITKDDFTIYGPNEGHWCPSKWFDVPITCRGLLSVMMWFNWKDQGYGNRKGRVGSINFCISRK